MGARETKKRQNKIKTASRLMQRRSALGNTCPSKILLLLPTSSTVRPAAVGCRLRDERSKDVKGCCRQAQAASSSLDAPLLAECQATGDKQASSQDRSGVAPSILTQELIRGVISRRRLHSQLAAVDRIKTYSSFVTPHYYQVGHNSAVTEYPVPCLHCPSLVTVDYCLYSSGKLLLAGYSIGSRRS